MKKLIFTLGIMIALINYSYLAQASSISKEKEQTIEQLIETTNSLKIGEIFINQFSKAFIDAFNKDGKMPESAKQIILDEVQSFFHEEIEEKKALTKILIPIYDKYYSLEEINGLIDFYNTPLGQKMITTMPQVTQEAMIAGSAWGKSIAQPLAKRVTARLEAEANK